MNHEISNKPKKSIITGSMRRLIVIILLVILGLVIIGYVIYYFRAGASTTGTFAMTNSIPYDTAVAAARLDHKYRSIAGAYFDQLAGNINESEVLLPENIKNCESESDNAGYQTCQDKMSLLDIYLDDVKMCVSANLSEECKAKLKKLVLLKLNVYADYNAKNLRYQMIPGDLETFLSEARNEAATTKVSHPSDKNAFAVENNLFSEEINMRLGIKTLGVDDYVMTFMNPPANQIPLNFCARVEDSSWLIKNNRDISQVNPKEWYPTININTNTLKCYPNTYTFSKYDSSQFSSGIQPYILVETLPGRIRNINVKDQIVTLTQEEFLTAIKYDAFLTKVPMSFR